MFGLISRETKEARYFVSYRTKNKLFSIVKSKVTTAIDEENLPPNENLKTRIFSDCYSSYQVEDF